MDVVTSHRNMSRLAIFTATAHLCFCFGCSPKPPSAELQRAVQANDVAAIERELKRGADCNAPMEEGATLLDLAALDGNIETVKCLLSHGAKISLENAHGTQ